MTGIHGPLCGPECIENAVRSTLDRATRPPPVKCPWCGADAGFACGTTGSVRRRRRPLRVFGPCHPSRLEVAA